MSVPPCSAATLAALRACARDDVECVVLGGGVVGVSCALSLARAGVRVRVLTRDMWPSTVSAVAGALCFPYAAKPVDRVAEWARVSIAFWRALHARSSNDDDDNTNHNNNNNSNNNNGDNNNGDNYNDAGVSLVDMYEFFDAVLGDDETPALFAACPDMQRVDGGAASLRDWLPLPSDVRSAFVMRNVPVMKPSRTMPFLLAALQRAGGSVHVVDGGVDDVRQLLSPSVAPSLRYVVNCTGLGARFLGGVVDDALFPSRGQVVCVARPPPSSSLSSSSSSSSSSASCRPPSLPSLGVESWTLPLAYSIGRDDDVVLGGTAIERCWETRVDEPLIEHIVERCCILQPQLRRASTAAGADSARLSPDEHARVARSTLDVRAPQASAALSTPSSSPPPAAPRYAAAVRIADEPPSERVRRGVRERFGVDVLRVRVGLRPCRDGGVRLERDERLSSPRATLVHCYGHGGSGWTLAPGCAAEVCRIIVNERNKRRTSQRRATTTRGDDDDDDDDDDARHAGGKSRL